MKSREELNRFASMVVEKLMNLDAPDPKDDASADRSETKKGKIARDFGIKEWDWPQGVGLYGLCRLQAQEGSTRFDDFLLNWYAENLKIGLPSKNINTTAPYLVLFDLTQRHPDPELMQLCADRAEWLMTGLPRTEDGCFQHVTTAIGDRNGVILNEGQVWADTLFMAVLFLGRMGLRHHRQDWIDESIHQFLVHIRYLQDIKTGLIYHGWTFRERNHFGGIFWCRGGSWFTYGAMDFLETMGDAIPAPDRKFIADAWAAQAHSLIRLQAEDGLWHTILDDPSSYEESSGSAAIAAGILSGVRLGYLEPEYAQAAEKAVDGLCANIAEDGTVLNVSAGTGMGMDAEHYKNILIAPMAYGQSLTLLALNEAAKL